MIFILANLSWSGVGLRAGVIAGALVVWFWTQSLIARKAKAKDGEARGSGTKLVERV